MGNWLRRLRGLIGNGVIWGSIWALGTWLYYSLGFLIAGTGFPPWRIVGPAIADGAVLGFASGSVFSIVLGVAYRRRLLADIRPLRVGVLGFASGLMIPVGVLAALGAAGYTFPLSAMIPGLVLGGSLGWVTSVGSVKLAQSADARIEGSGRPLIES
jgi:hypothetical protein